MDPISSLILIIIALIIVGIIYLLIITAREEYSRREKLRKKYGKVPDHTELYFEEYFPTMMKEWDIITKPRLQRWNKKTRQKMTSIDKNLDEIIDYRKGLDKRIDTLENDVSSLEKKK